MERESEERERVRIYIYIEKEREREKREKHNISDSILVMRIKKTLNKFLLGRILFLINVCDNQ